MVQSEMHFWLSEVHHHISNFKNVELFERFGFKKGIVGKVDTCPQEFIGIEGSSPEQAHCHILCFFLHRSHSCRLKASARDLCWTCSSYLSSAISTMQATLSNQGWSIRTEKNTLYRHGASSKRTGVTVRPGSGKLFQPVKVSSSSSSNAGVRGSNIRLPELNDSYETMVTFTDYANWLVPGVLMAGRYPFVEPSRCTSRTVGEEQLERIISHGIKTFVSLQGEIPHQKDMPLKGVDGFQGYKAPATLIAAALSDPPTVEEMNGLRTPYLDKFLPPKKNAPKESRRIIELDFLHYPIVDLSVPTMGQLDGLVDCVIERIQGGDVLYLHCWGGRGRAGTVGACVLGKMYGLSGEEALERVQRAFDTRNDGGRKSPETGEQHDLVMKYLS